MWEALAVVLIVLVGGLPLVLLCGAIAGMGPVQYDPMSYDEEMRWLTEEHGLSREEADGYASISHRSGPGKRT